MGTDPEDGRSKVRRPAGHWWRRGVLALGLVIVLLLGSLAYSVFHPGGRPQDPAGLGTDPKLAPTDGPLIPTTNAANVQGWPAGRTPSAPRGFAVTQFAAGLDHPRWLYQLPNGDVLAAEADTRRQTDSLVSRVFNWLRRNDGSGQRPSANRITLLRDTNGDGVADVQEPFLDNLNQPFGMALVGTSLYVCTTDGVWRYTYQPGQTRISTPGVKIMDLPAGGYNNHWTRNILASQDGNRLYVTVGSASNIGENGLDRETRRAAVLEITPDGSGQHVRASGMRNPNGLAVEPTTGMLWTVVNERDLAGDDVPPDYLTRVRDGDFYGWPWSYWGQHVDERVQPPRPDLVAKALPPDYALGAHVAALGLTFYNNTAFPEHYRTGAFISEHGSWNRGYPVGFKVVYVPFQNGLPAGPPEDFLTGFKADPATSDTFGRPVGVIADRTGGLLVADDAGDTVWRVAAAH